MPVGSQPGDDVADLADLLPVRTEYRQTRELARENPVSGRHVIRLAAKGTERLSRLARLYGMGRPQDPAPQPWYVLIEETRGGGQGMRWGLTRMLPFPSRADALAEAADLAGGYKPEHPKREQRRLVFKTGEDVWTVWLEGAMHEFHFRVSVAQLVAAT